MPNIPNVPGVPSLPNYSVNGLVLLVADLIDPLIANSGPQWGIFLDGEMVIESDNTVSFDQKQDLPVSTYPVEDGGFMSYDKVTLPADILVRVSAGGSVANRQLFLSSIDAVMNTTDLYDVVTPETAYASYNFTHRDLHRDASKGSGLIVVDLHLVEIRVTATATFNSTASPTAAGQQNIGNVQPQTPSAYVQQQFEAGNWAAH